MEKYAGDGLYLVGTAHISPRSVEETREVILRRRPRLVGVELCRPRMDALAHRQKWERMSILDVLRSGKGFLLMAQVYLSMTQRRMGKDFGVEPGSEMLMALSAARDVGADVVLLDRDITVTFRRAWSEMGLREKFRMFWFSTKALVGFDGEGGEGEQELDLEALMEEDTLTAMLEEVRTVAPSATRVLLDERDETLAIRARLAMASGDRREWVKGGGEKDRWLVTKEIPDVEAPVIKEEPARGAVKGAKGEGGGKKRTGEKRADTGKERGGLGGKEKDKKAGRKKEEMTKKRKEEGKEKGKGKKKKGAHRKSAEKKPGTERPADMVAVVGAGHVKGLTRRLKGTRARPSRKRLGQLETMPVKKWPWYRVLGYAIIGLFFALVIYLAWFGEWELLRNLAILWFLTNGVCAAVAVALVRGHPLSVGAAFIAAPITSLNPTVGAGWVAGMVEAKVRTPTVADMKELGRMESMDEFWGNRAIRVLMVAALGNVGSTIGTILFWALLPRIGDLPLL